jgi:putative transposase
MEAFLEDGAGVREGKWTQSIAIGAEAFVEKTKREFGMRGRDRKVVKAGSVYQLREPQVSYPAHFGLENDDIGAENIYFWDVYY